MLRTPWRRQQESNCVYRSRSSAVAAIVWLAISNGFAASVIVREPGNASIIVLALLYGAISTILLVRLLWAGIFIVSSGLHVANITESFDLRWEEIERFELGRWKLIPRTCLIYLRDGSIKHAAGVEESVNFPNGEAASFVAELNRELHEKTQLSEFRT